MNIEINGTTRDIAEGSTLASVIETGIGSMRGSAAAVDGEVVPRSRWSTYELTPGVSIELITAVQGG